MARRCAVHVRGSRCGWQRQGHARRAGSLSPQALWSRVALSPDANHSRAARTSPLLRSSMIELQQFSKVYGDLVAVKGLNLRIEAGQLFGFIGPNGAGK